MVDNQSSIDEGALQFSSTMHRCQHCDGRNNSTEWFDAANGRRVSTGTRQMVRGPRPWCQLTCTDDAIRQSCGTTPPTKHPFDAKSRVQAILEGRVWRRTLRIVPSGAPWHAYFAPYTHEYQRLTMIQDTVSQPGYAYKCDVKAYKNDVKTYKNDVDLSTFVQSGDVEPYDITRNRAPSKPKYTVREPPCRWT